jgi:virulence factor Mce-like protein
MSRRPSASIVANPVLVGAVTTLVVVVAVFLAYNANNGLPFVPTRQIYVDIGSGSGLVGGNEVREGGFRIGTVTDIKPKTLPSGGTVANVKLKLDKTVGEIPDDTQIAIRPRSALGLKYIQFTRGTSHRYLKDGDTIPISHTNVPVQFEDLYKMFDAPTRRAQQADLDIFGSGFAGRGASVNEFIVQARPLVTYLPPVARNLVSPETNLRNFFRQLDIFVRNIAPISQINARTFTDMATTFEAISRDEQALRDTIAKSPSNLSVSTRSLIAQRPFLRDSVLLARDLRPAARDLRVMLPTISSALETGVPVLRRTPSLNARTRETLQALKNLAEAPTTNMALRALTDTVGILNPLIRFLGPYQTVCNGFGYQFTYLGEHLTAEDNTGTAQRVLINSAPPQKNSLSSEGAYEPANATRKTAAEEGYPSTGSLFAGLPGGPLGGIGAHIDEIIRELFGDPAVLHGQPYAGAIDNKGNADCEIGQRGYPENRMALKIPNRDSSGNRFQIVTDPHTPGNQGSTYRGRPDVPEGETFSREPEWPPAGQLPPALETGTYGGW